MDFGPDFSRVKPIERKPSKLDLAYDEAMSQYESERYNGFLPDKGAYDSELEATLASITGQIPVAEENFNADLAARGLFASGEAPKAMYRDVYAPVAREAYSAAAKNRLAYAQAYQQGSMASEQLRAQYLSTVINLLLNREQLKLQKSAQSSGMFGDIFGGIISAGAQIGAAALTGGASLPATAAVMY
jgi:hypothetical protein